MENDRKFFKKSDIIIISAILLVALIAFVLFSTLTEKENLYAKISYDNKVIAMVDLSDADKEFSLPEVKQITFKLEDNKICFYHSNCPHKLCVNSGWLYLEGQSAACLPNKATILIVTDKDNVVVIDSN